MKKVLLSAFALSAAFFANAQGITATYATDDFTSATEVTGAGTAAINFGKDSVNNAVAYDSVYVVPKTTTTAEVRTTTRVTNGRIKQIATRNGDGELSYLISQPRTVYYPIVVSFGTGNTIDIAAKKIVRIVVGPSDSALYFKIALIDNAGKKIDAVGPNGGRPGEWYRDEVGFSVQPVSGAVTTSINTNANLKSSITATRFIASQPYREVIINYGFTTAKPYGQYYKADGSVDGADSTTFDWTKVAQLQITPLNDKNLEKFAYSRNKLENVPVIFKAISVGGDYITGFEEANSYAAAKGFVVYPNPAKDKVSFNGVAENVKISDVLGNVVFSAASASEVNVSTFNKGIYTVQSSKGAARLVVE